MITKFDEFAAAPRNQSITRQVVTKDTDDVQAKALARIVKLAGKCKLTNPDETVRSVFDKMLVRSLSFLASDEEITAEIKKYDSILDTLGNSANNPNHAVVDQHMGTKDRSNEAVSDAWPDDFEHVYQYVKTRIQSLAAVQRGGNVWFDKKYDSMEVKWADENKVYVWDGEYDEHPSGPAYNADIATVAAVSALYSDYRITLDTRDGFGMTLTINKKKV